MGLDLATDPRGATPGRVGPGGHSQSGGVPAVPILIRYPAIAVLRRGIGVLRRQGNRETGDRTGLHP